MEYWISQIRKECYTTHMAASSLNHIILRAEMITSTIIPGGSEY